MKKIQTVFLGLAIALSSCSIKYDVPTEMNSWKSADGTSVKSSELTLKAGDAMAFAGRTTEFVNFELTGMARTENGSAATIRFHNKVGHSGYAVLFHNSAMDGSRQTGSLQSVRNLYRSLVADGEWFPFSIAVRGKNIEIKINNTDVVCYTEPTNPYRIEAHSNMLLSSGNIKIEGLQGNVGFKDMIITRLRDDAVNPNDTLPAVDEQNDAIIRLQQQDFPVIDYHVHLKGGLTAEMAHAMSMNYGINYGVAPNAGEGGVGRMLANDNEVYEYYNEVKNLPFLRGVQGEGRRWMNEFSNKALSTFDYLFTDAMTIFDHHGKNSRIYRPEEVNIDIPYDKYMEQIVNETVRILSTEPADIYANPTFIPTQLNTEYDKYWTDERIDRVLRVLKENNIALEINPRYVIPSKKIIRKAKSMGIKFTFGTNNVDANFGKLEYCIEVIKDCGITVDDLWFPTMSNRAERYKALYPDRF